MTKFEDVRHFVYEYFRNNHQLATPSDDDANNPAMQYDQAGESSKRLEKTILETKSWTEIKEIADNYWCWTDEQTVWLLESMLEKFAGIGDDLKEVLCIQD